MIIDPPDFEIMRGRRGFFRLTSSMTLYWVEKDTILEVPEGVETDFASVPFGFRNIIHINGPHALPAVAHDYLYGKAGFVQNVHYTRKEADRLFYTLMKSEGVSTWKAWSMYQAVRGFGGVHLLLTGGAKWKSHKS